MRFGRVDVHVSRRAAYGNSTAALNNRKEDLFSSVTGSTHSTVTDQLTAGFLHVATP